MKILLLVLCVYMTSCAVLSATVEERIKALEKDNKAIKKKDKKLTRLINQQKSTISSLQTTVNDQQTTVNNNLATISSLQTTVDDNVATISTLQTALNALGPANIGTNYVRWGRTVCPTGSTLLYNGYMGKSHYTHSGSGGNYQCLHSSPEDPDNFDATRRAQSLIYGVEYESDTTFPNRNMINNNAPCAVCVVTRGQKIMIPGKKACHAGWTMEYTGVLMAENHSHSKSSYVCVDKDPEAIPGGSANSNGGLLYHVEAECTHTASPCPPYKHGVEIACVVCTK